VRAFSSPSSPNNCWHANACSAQNLLFILPICSNGVCCTLHCRAPPACRVPDLAAHLDVPRLLRPASADAAAAPAELLQLLSDTADACQAALTAATAAAEPQGLIQAYARLQQMQGRSIAVPAGAPASLAITSKVLTIIESLSVAPAAASGPAAAAAPVPVAAVVKPSSAGGKAAAEKAAIVSPVSKVEQVSREASQCWDWHEHPAAR
jgi:hypothetical protein